MSSYPILSYSPEFCVCVCMPLTLTHTGSHIFVSPPEPTMLNTSFKEGKQVGR